MKDTIKIFGIIALVAVMGILAAGCASAPKPDEVVEAGDFRGRVSSDGNSVKITSYTGTSKDIQIPSEIRGLPVTTISGSAFHDKQLTNIIIPKSVTIIENGTTDTFGMIIATGAFAKNQLTSVTIPDNVITIGNYAFAYNQLTNVTIPEGVTLGDRVFAENPQLTNPPMSQNDKERAQQREEQLQEKQAEQERLANLYRQAGNNLGNLRNTSRSYQTYLAGYLTTIYNFGDGNYIRQIIFEDGSGNDPTTGTYRVNGDTVIFLSSKGEYSSGTIVGTTLNIGGNIYR